MCSNSTCSNIPDFGFNRTDFIHSNKDIICSVCGNISQYIPCQSRLIIEQDLENGSVAVKHYGTHTCPVKLKRRPDSIEIEAAMNENPKLTREAIIRQRVTKHLEFSDFTSAVNEAKKYTDTKYLDNTRYKLKKCRRPDGHSFKAVSVLKERFDKQDKFLIFGMNDGSDGRISYVMKSSNRKVKLMNACNKDGLHPLASTAVHLDVVHSRCKGWETYTLSYHDVILRSMIKLATMETVSECHQAFQLFFKLINTMLKEHIRGASRYIYSTHLKDDEHGGNKIGMRTVLGETFVKERTSSVEYHYDASVKRHRRYLKTESRKITVHYAQI